MPPKSTLGDGSRSTWGDPKTALAPQFWGTRECILPPKLGGWGGAVRLLQEVYR